MLCLSLFLFHRHVLDESCYTQQPICCGEGTVLILIFCAITIKAHIRSTIDALLLPHHQQQQLHPQHHHHHHQHHHSHHHYHHYNHPSRRHHHRRHHHNHHHHQDNYAAIFIFVLVLILLLLTSRHLTLLPLRLLTRTDVSTDIGPV